MHSERLMPLRFRPVFKTALWGGTHLQELLQAPVEQEPTGEAWLLSDQGANQSVVIDGPWQGTTLRQLMERVPERLLGRNARMYRRFPLLLKFIDAAQPLSIQVHPTDELARQLEPTRDGNGKTEAWFILRAEPDATIYAGLRAGVTVAHVESAVAEQRGLEAFVEQYEAKVGDCFFLPAGTIHAIGSGLLLFEVQQTSDITYRLSDWGRVDPKTGQPRELHLAKGLQCLDDTLGPCRPITGGHTQCEDALFDALVQCDYFTLARWDSQRRFHVGALDECRVIVCIGGSGSICHAETEYPLRFGDVLLLPAEVGVCDCVPDDAITLLECGIV
jgi:mannose-6-phosphate isomerase